MDRRSPCKYFGSPGAAFSSRFQCIYVRIGARDKDPVFLTGPSKGRFCPAMLLARVLPERL